MCWGRNLKKAIRRCNDWEAMRESTGGMVVCWTHTPPCSTPSLSLLELWLLPVKRIENPHYCIAHMYGKQLKVKKVISRDSSILLHYCYCGKTYSWQWQWGWGKDGTQNLHSFLQAFLPLQFRVLIDWGPSTHSLWNLCYPILGVVVVPYLKLRSMFLPNT